MGHSLSLSFTAYNFILYLSYIYFIIKVKSFSNIRKRRRLRALGNPVKMNLTPLMVDSHYLLSRGQKALYSHAEIPRYMIINIGSD